MRILDQLCEKYPLQAHNFDLKSWILLHALSLIWPDSNRTFGMFHLVILVLILACLTVNYSRVSAQSAVVPLSRGCEGATESGLAVEKLNQLRELTPDTPGLSEAISRCEKKLQLLLQSEESEWNKAVSSRDSFDCANAKRLFLEFSRKNTHRRGEANREYRKLRDCKEEAAALDEDKTTLRQAEGAFNVRNFTLARHLAQRVASRPGSLQGNAQELLERIDLRERNNNRYNQARTAIARKQFDEACRLLGEIQTSDPSFKDLDDYRAMAGGCPPPVEIVAKPVPPASADPQSAGVVKKLHRLYASGDFVEAHRELKRARLSSQSRETQTLIQKIESAYQAEDSAINAAVRLFFEGNYAQAKTELRRFLDEKRSPHCTAYALFCLGATVTSEYYLNGAANDGLRQEALQLFAQSTDAYAGFSPRWTYVSPRVRTLFAEATSRQTK
jgi:tetratricopeptide (TPR) repeat protein